MKLIIDIPEEQIPTRQEIIDIPIHFMDKQVVEAGGYEFMQIPNNATNGDVIMAMFPNEHDFETDFDTEWWNAKYEGSNE